MPKLQIQAACDKRKMTHYRLAILLKIDNSNVARLFRPGYNPTFQTLCAIAKALKCRVRDLIKE